MKIGARYILILIISLLPILTTETLGQINIYRLEERKCDNSTEQALDSLDSILIDKKILAEEKEFKNAIARIESKYYSISFMNDFQDSISIYINGRFQQQTLAITNENLGHALTIKIKKGQKTREELTCVYGDSLFSFSLNHLFTYYTIYLDKSKSWIVYYSKCDIGELE